MPSSPICKALASNSVALKRYIAAVCAGIVFAASAALAETVDVEAGKKVFSKCKGCHEVGQDARHRIGPHLNGLFGRVAASHEGFKYSKSFQRAGAGGLEWHAETLDAFLEDPRSMTSGTRMSFRGLKSRQDRVNLIAYLRTFSDDPANIPEADPTVPATDHDLDPTILALKGDPEYGEYLSGECTTCHQAAGSDDRHSVDHSVARRGLCGRDARLQEKTAKTSGHANGGRAIGRRRNRRAGRVFRPA